MRPFHLVSERTAKRTHSRARMAFRCGALLDEKVARHERAFGSVKVSRMVSRVGIEPRNPQIKVVAGIRNP